MTQQAFKDPKSQTGPYPNDSTPRLVGIIMYAAPLSVLQEVVRTKSSKPGCSSRHGLWSKLAERTATELIQAPVV